MQAEYVFPLLSDRSSPKEWYEKDRPDLLARVVARKQAIQNAPNSSCLSAEQEREIRSRFTIHLD